MATDLARYAIENREAIMEAYRERHRTIVVAATDPALEDKLYGHQGNVIIVDEHGVELGRRSELFPCARISYGRSYVEDIEDSLRDVEVMVAKVEADLAPKEAKPRKGWETPYGPAKRK